MNDPAPNPFTNSGKLSCLEMLQLVLDGQATSEQIAYFKKHMEVCMPCYKSYSVDMMIKDMLQRKCCGSGIAPETLDSIRQKISASIKPL
ncbi:MAG: hypothetical protein K1X47_05630 [Cyclobacteriaceae bacterium]|nr:hypothetical protein [Cyclobacteriaceae bacterium]